MTHQQRLGNLFLQSFAYSADSADKQKHVTYEKIVEMLEKDVPITRISKELDVARNTIDV